ncbi:MAG: hypothetical protein A2Y62_03395 [Candidatus Fischerbacteria bacterium RBG_13_37_8]|uniref:Uncharacterized protein n=1 Tax=Candidatus Fischerbacteria bacterium RBG_13_37_8 TaxID=1817863 RepID=A0A1F5VK61_9BACT|nr:MAG: hypothetical protein A2Y62_03395 [Candidatus Fischerbacteria bacterium RBG_13_37_8]
MNVIQYTHNHYINIAEELARKMTESRKSFWEIVHREFSRKNISKPELRQVVYIGLKHIGYCWKKLLPYFNIQESDYKKFMNFLNKQGITLSCFK